MSDPPASNYNTDTGSSDKRVAIIDPAPNQTQRYALTISLKGRFCKSGYDYICCYCIDIKLLHQIVGILMGTNCAP